MFLSSDSVGIRLGALPARHICRPDAIVSIITQGIESVTGSEQFFAIREPRPPATQNLWISFGRGSMVGKQHEIGWKESRPMTKTIDTVPIRSDDSVTPITPGEATGP